MTGVLPRPDLRRAAAAEALAVLAEQAQAKALGLSPAAQAFLTGRDLAGAAELEGPSDPYRRSLWVYRCIRQMATSGCGVPLRLSVGEPAGTRAAFGCKHVRWGRPSARIYGGTEKDCELKARPGEIVQAGPLRQLLDQPNDSQTWAEFIEQTIGIFLICGRLHWLYEDMAGRRPVSMRLVPGTLTRAITEPAAPFGERLIGWSVRWEGREYPITLEECLTWQVVHPLQPARLFSPAEPAWLAVVSDYNASLFNASMFGNSAEPGGALITDQPYSPEREEQIRAAWRQRHQGAARARSVAVLWGGLKWQEIASSLTDMQFGEGKRLTRTEICAAWGLSEVVAGFYTDANYGFAEAGQEQFWWATEGPLLNRFAEGINVHLCPRFPGNQIAWFDVEDSPVVERMRTKRLEAVSKLFGMGVPLADANELYDLGLTQRPWYQVGFLPSGLLPAADVAEGNVFPGLPEGPSGPGRDLLDQHTDRETTARLQIAGSTARRAVRSAPLIERDARDRIWRAWAASWAALARAMRPILRARWFSQQRRFTAALRRELPAAGPGTAVLRQAGEVLGRLLLEVFHDPADRRRFATRVRSFLADGSELGLRQAFAEAGLAGEALEAAVARLLRDPALTAALASEATRISSLIDGATERYLRRSLTQGMDAGESILQLADRVESVMQNRRAGAMVVARNAVGGSLSRARWEGQRAAGMTHKFWLHSRGPGERRPAHVAAEAFYAANPCPIHQPFLINGVALMFPRDHAANAPGETVNCQCLCLARRLAGEQGAAGLTQIEFLTYDHMISARRPDATAPAEQEQSPPCN